MDQGRPAGRPFLFAMKTTDTEEILDFWFGSLLETGLPDADHSRLWFGKDARVDAHIRARFQSLVLTEGQHSVLKTDDTHMALARVVLLDQFPRNIWRGQAQAFAFDPQALAQALDALDRGLDRQLPEVARAFIYLPLEHAEDLELQKRCVGLFRAMAEQAPEKLKAACASYLDYAERHRDIIARFGRFPHRNAILGRASTPEEVDFLKQPGSGF